MPILLVESPNKVEKLRSLTGMRVIATYGHMYDLPGKSLGVDLETYEGAFEPIPSARKTLAYLKSACAGEEVYIATDPDREGFAIGKFAYDLVRETASTCYRTEIRELTKASVSASLKASVPFEKANDGQFQSFLGRRLVDRLVGYLLSPQADHMLEHLPNYRFSVGRVQSPALRLVVDRENEIRAFVAEKYWTIKLVSKDGRFPEMQHHSGRIFDETERDRVLGALRASKTVSFVAQDTTKETFRAPAPFVSTTMQAACSRKFGIPPHRVMQVAQDLFSAGLITYHRTDSVRVASWFIQAAREKITSKYGAPFCPEKPIYRSSPKSQADAHEAIRPTVAVFGAEGQYIIRKAGMSELHVKIYAEICNRAMMSQMAACEKQRCSAVYECGGEKFKATETATQFTGWTVVEGASASALSNSILTKPIPLSEKEIQSTVAETQPPSRFTEAAIVEELDRLEIGRPSTSASVSKLLLDKEYLVREGRALRPTENGEKLLAYLKSDHPWVVDYETTKELEATLDKVENAEFSAKDVIQNAHARMNFFKISDLKLFSPSVNLNAQVLRLAEVSKLELPPSVFDSAATMRNYCREASKKISTEKAARMNEYPLSEKQMNVLLKANEPDADGIVNRSAKMALKKVQNGNFNAGRAFISKYLKELQAKSPKRRFKKSWKKRV